MTDDELTAEHERAIRERCAEREGGGLRPFDEEAGLLLDELLKTYRIKGRHRTTCDLSTALKRDIPALLAALDAARAAPAQLRAKLSEHVSAAAEARSRTSHYAHFDREGRAGAACPACHASIEVGKHLAAIAAALKETDHG